MVVKVYGRLFSSDLRIRLAASMGLPDRSAGAVDSADLAPFNASAQGRNRTVDTRIFSPLLYRLSYLGSPKFLRTPPLYEDSPLPSSIKLAQLIGYECE